ncbi:MurR/RpiR family transcriptional regulator [Marinilactibacillus psychrotolerans]|uniref:MurR/RpiR family transcriptional regulator n=1 Tax=Marinilactibacillus psychrotolerans TaxID=191770 RepID=A0A5R9C1F1_9LACT|nr:MurR/RpiR family transcriptional regulator [Marinilactibacillus psychrotolerans]TLQ06504.1 MurR/RpiR family transcriptional regulator [Marinilactibacillus psychrotolerans]
MNFNWSTADMTQSQQKIAEYVERHYQTVLLYTEQELADTLDLSIASISRFWRFVGYKNMKDFKKKTTQQMTPTPAKKIETILSQTETANGIAKNFHTVINHLEFTAEQFSEERLNEVSIMINQSHKVYIYAQGSSIGLQELLYFRLARYGLSIHKMVNNGSELLEDMVHIQSNDVVILFAFGRKALVEEEVIFSQAKAIGYKVIAVTDQLVSAITNQADITLFGSRGEPWEFHSMVAPTLIVEMLVIAVSSYDKKSKLEQLEKLQTLRKQYKDILPR